MYTKIKSLEAYKNYLIYELEFYTYQYLEAFAHALLTIDDGGSTSENGYVNSINSWGTCVQTDHQSIDNFYLDIMNT